jgi:hypothetical protein
MSGVQVSEDDISVFGYPHTFKILFRIIADQFLA